MSREGLGNLLLQWGAAMGLFALLNRWLVRRTEAVRNASE